jgi:hypothetical protein
MGFASPPDNEAIRGILSELQKQGKSNRCVTWWIVGISLCTLVAAIVIPFIAK